eukprot:m.356790 g.356790  ORF g.356790 m.356790 type:complete len:71 (-) comp28020_c0_seq38:770-982(-)
MATTTSHFSSPSFNSRAIFSPVLQKSSYVAYPSGMLQCFNQFSAETKEPHFDATPHDRLVLAAARHRLAI